MTRGRMSYKLAGPELVPEDAALRRAQEASSMSYRLRTELDVNKEVNCNL
jgi:hypothetical protein